jgi:nitrite reductase (NADH) large subunit
MTPRERLVVIGNGMAGARFVEELVARGGGDRFEILVFGEEPHGNYNRILLSSVLAGLHHPQDIFINPLSWYASHGVVLRCGVKAGWIDRVSKSVYAPGGVAEPYDKLVIATGSTPFVPPMNGLHEEEGGFKPGVFVFRTIDDCADILDYAQSARRAAVIGGGLLGLEAARGLLEQGLEVHVVHINEHLMDSQLDPQAGAMLRQALEAQGVHMHLGRQTEAVLGDGRVRGLAFKNGSTLDCDLVVVAAGVRPNTDLARQAGLQVQRGIVVSDDLSCRNDGSIYALGECAQHRGRLYGLVAPLWEQARILADRLSGRNPDASYAGSRVSTKLKVMGVELAVMGEKDPNQESDELVHYSEPGRGVYKKLIIRDGRLAGAILLGDGPAIPGVLQAFDRGEALPQNRSELLFPSAGAPRTVPVADLPAAAQVCNCNGVSKGKIVEAVRQGRRNLQEVCNSTRAGTGCGSCKSGAQAILDQVVREGAGDGYTAPVPKPAAAFRPAWD